MLTAVLVDEATVWLVVPVADVSETRDVLEEILRGLCLDESEWSEDDG